MKINTVFLKYFMAHIYQTAADMLGHQLCKTLSHSTLSHSTCISTHIIYRAADVKHFQTFVYSKQTFDFVLYRRFNENIIT